MIPQEIETTALVVNSPVEIDSNVRASQIQGINLHVDFRARDNKKGSRKARRCKLYDLSQSYEGNNDEYVSDSFSEGQEQDMTSEELQTIVAAGNTLEIDFAHSDILKMKKMIEYDAKNYFLLQKNNNAFNKLSHA
ncbi:hypothetical protein RHSIM_Rhsim11G0108900 [Rhododendron simsii]|uniref:Uncharacterized protein n=1 Tax=Rhododendron simsii TaxID=118357 RepID=A0A834G859_RHOSS|nr:hypothetical protein RHSIM_Rhsim11G0108900 [Rhododendron simsii]